MAWTDEKKAKAIEMYKQSNPTPETSVELVKSIAEEIDETANGLRMILTSAGVYVKKTAGAAAGASSTTKTASTRVSKSDSIKSLKDIIEATGNEADDEILDKLTGKQAVYFTAIFKSLDKGD